MKIRKAASRGHADYGWLKTYHTFSFGSFSDPGHMSFRSLRVMNEDRVAPGRGFGTHAHDNMEIVSYVLDGELEHKDSMGNGEVLRPGEFQRISAGAGIAHSEFNPSDTNLTHFYQIWLLPKERNIEPSYEQKRFDDEELSNALRLVASPDGDAGSLTINQDARIYLSKLTGSRALEYPMPAGRSTWLQILRGTIRVESGPNSSTELSDGDGASFTESGQLKLTASPSAEIMLFDLA